MSGSKRDSQSDLLADSLYNPGSENSDDSPAQITDMRCVDFESRVVPRKDYVFVIEVTWSNEQKMRIRRNHDKLFQFQCRLLDAFPREAGQDSQSDRIIPFLPGKKMFRGNSKSAAQERFPQIREYINMLKSLPNEIVHSDIVRSFFSPHPEDLVRSKSVELLDKFAEDVGKSEKSRTLPSDARLPDSDDEDVFTGAPAVQSEFRLLTM